MLKNSNMKLLKEWREKMKKTIKRAIFIFIISFILFFIGRRLQIHIEYQKILNGEYNYIKNILSEMYHGWDSMYIFFYCIKNALLYAVYPVIIYLYSSLIATLYKKGNLMKAISICMIIVTVIFIIFLIWFLASFRIEF